MTDSHLPSIPQVTSARRRHVLRSVLSNYVGKLILLGSSFFMTPFILRQLGETHYALWVLVGSVVAYGNLLDLGISGAVIKYVAEYRAKGELAQAQSLVATALRLYSVLGLLTFVLCASGAPFFSRFFNVPAAEQDTTSALILLMGLALGISIACSPTSSVLRGLQRFDLSNLLGTLGLLTSIVATVVVLWLGGGLLGLVAINIPITLAMQALSVFVIRRIAPDLHFGWRGAKRAYLRTISSFSAALFAVNVAGQLQAKTDEIVIAASLPLTAVTPYNFARRLSEIPQILTDQFMKVLPPLASELHTSNDPAKLRALYLTSTRLTLAIFLPIGGSFIILARPLLSVWVGAAYADSAFLVAILITASLIDTSMWPAGSILQGMARHQPIALMSIASGVANLLLSLLLVQPLGVMGVALGTLIPTSIECVCFVTPYALRVIGVSLRDAFAEIYWPAGAPALPMLLVLYLLSVWLSPTSWFTILAIAAAGTLVYGTIYLSLSGNTFERQLCWQTIKHLMSLIRARWAKNEDSK